MEHAQMLTNNCQKILIHFYGAPSFTKEQAVKICGTERTFYRACIYLLKNGFIEKIKETPGYRITLVKGTLMADMLTGLNDNPFMTRDKAVLKKLEA
jgi:hypothetical protein